MKSEYAWVLGLIFIIAFAYLAWNNFELPFIEFGETSTTEGRIIEIKIGHGVGGGGYVQKVKYAYEVDDKYYTDIKTVDKKIGLQYIGNRVDIEYSSQNPTKNHVIGFYKDFTNNNTELFHHTKRKQIGSYQIDLINNMFYYNEYGKRGKEIENIIGKFDIIRDTLIVSPYNLDSNKIIYYKLKYLVTLDSLGCTVLIDFKNNRKYIELSE